MRVDRILLWITALAIFVILPIHQGFDHRTWAEILLIYGGMTVLMYVLSDSMSVFLFGGWAVIVHAVHPIPALRMYSFQVVLFIVIALGIYQAAKVAGAHKLIKTIALIQIPVMMLQAVKLYDPLIKWSFNIVGPAIRIFYPSAVPGSAVVYNTARPISGLTGSSADLGCVLAICLPFMTMGRYPVIGTLVILTALFATQSTSAIVAGLAGLLIVCWPQVKKLGIYWMLALSIMAAGAVNAVDGLMALLGDDRWKVWGLGIKRIVANPMGTGWGTWPMGLIKGEQIDIWGRAHFDILQVGVEAGLIAVALAIFILTESFMGALQRGHRVAAAAVAAIGIVQFGHFPFHLATAGTVAVLALAEARRPEQ